MAPERIPDDIFHYLQSVTNRRAKIVIDHIIKNGFITTEDINEYGYEHPPRAVRDVKEAGIPIVRYSVKNKAGNRTIAAYKFGDLSQIDKVKTGGRSSFPKEFIAKLMTIQNKKCSICNIQYDERYLQVDHRIPYEVAGSKFDTTLRESDFQLLCGSCNRAKSWSCEHCLNWINDKKNDICSNCYWANPINYLHIAQMEIRRSDIAWIGNEIESYEKLREDAKKEMVDIPFFVKKIISIYQDPKK